MNISEPKMRVELHLHTCYSLDSLLSIETMIDRARELGIDRLAVTDHNEIEGALAAQKLAPELIIVGEEIQTTVGELLGYFMTEKIPEGLEPEEVLRRLKDQGAVISVAHPFDRRGGIAWEWEQLADLSPMLDAVEVFNARCLSQEFNQRAQAFADEFGLSGTVGSDAHSAVELGTAILSMTAFQSADDFREALKSGTAVVKPSPPYVRLYSRHAKMTKKWHQTLDSASESEK